MSGNEEGFLSRWSRRKQAAGESGPVTPASGGEPAAGKDARKSGTNPEETVDLSKLPAIEGLGKDSDYTMFMHKAVPEELRLKALRRMWSTDPALAVPELLDIHAWDYTGTDGIKPLVSPALEALAAQAREAAEHLRKAALEEKSPGESPAAETADKGESKAPNELSSG